MISWQLPWVGLLFPLPWLIRAWLPARRDIGSGVRLPFLSQLGNPIDANTHSTATSLRQWLAWLVWTLALAAAAGPTWVGDPIEQPRSGRDLMLAIDTSQSMQESDMVIGGRALSRMDAVKVVATDFVEQREGDRIGLVLFGNQAYLQTPMTFDRHSVIEMLNDAVVGIAGKNTAIGDAIGLTIKRLEDAGTADKVLILITDGRNTAGQVDPIEASRLAAASKLKIHTIGVGSDANRGGLLGGFFSTGGNDLDEPTLRTIAANTGGTYYRARNPKELAQIYAELNALEAVESDVDVFRPEKNLFYWPLGAATCLSAMALLLTLVSSLVRRSRREVLA